MSELLNTAAQGAKSSARALLVQCLLVLFALLIGITGSGFLVFWTFDALSAAAGARIAAFLLGAGLILVAAGILLFVFRTPQAAPPPETTEPPRPKPTPTDALSIVAFTSAFVLGRLLTNRKRR